MVLYYESTHVFPHDFASVSYAYLNRYPNPYAKHVLSQDSLETFVDERGQLHTTKFIIKRGRLPNFMKPFLGNSLDSWIIEKTLINPDTKTMLTYTSNVDHRKFIRVEEYLTYKGLEDQSTSVRSVVKFSSNLVGFKQRIEEWSQKRFAKNLVNSRDGLRFVIQKLKEKKWGEILA